MDGFELDRLAGPAAAGPAAAGAASRRLLYYAYFVWKPAASSAVRASSSSATASRGNVWPPLFI